MRSVCVCVRRVYVHMWPYLEEEIFNVLFLVLETEEVGVYVHLPGPKSPTGTGQFHPRPWHIVDSEQRHCSVGLRVSC